MVLGLFHIGQFKRIAGTVRVYTYIKTAYFVIKKCGALGSPTNANATQFYLLY